MKKKSTSQAAYTEKSIKSLDPMEHIRRRPGMYIGKLGNGTAPDDGIYILLKEVIDNCIDEFVMGHGKKVDITMEEGVVEVRDYGRGIPLGKLYDCSAIINTGGKFDSEAFKRSVGLNGVGIKAVNALSNFFEVQAFREGKTRAIEFSGGKVTDEVKRARSSKEKDGTRIMFIPDPEIFGEDVQFRMEFVEQMLRHYSYLNPGLTLDLNGEKQFVSKNGLVDLLTEKLGEEQPQYPMIHLEGDDVEVAFTHMEGYGEEYYSFVNGQHTTQGGTHQAAFREALVKEVREFYKKNYDPSDVRTSIVAAISIRVQEPVFESQTKTKLGSTHMEKDGRPVRGHMSSFITEQLDNFLHRNPATAKALQAKIVRSEKERKEIGGIRKLAKEGAKKAKIHNRKLRDCRIHYNTNHKDKEDSTLFITEGDSASGSITTARDVQTQAVFSLRGKPLNCFSLSRKIVYQNEEFNLLQNALDIEDGLDNLRYSRVVLATDADVDGMHIRLLLITFFLRFFPELVREGHLFILETPLFRVRNKKETIYCYDEEEKQEALSKLGKAAEVTRFKGLGEISPSEFKRFIGEEMRLEPVTLDSGAEVKEMLTFYMGKNTPERQGYIIENLRVEQDLIEDEAEQVEQEEPLAVAG